jgi:type II secretory pathway pseudopilin PulG
MMTRLRSEAGFSLVEVLVATGLLLAVSSIVTTALLQMTNHQQTIWNRTEMHSGVRGATELLQQEVGQAGRATLPAPVTLTAPIVTAPNTSCTATVGPPAFVPVSVTATVSTPLAGVNATAGMFVGEWLTTLDGDSSETVAITAITSATTFQACFTQSHAAATTTIVALGGFATGIVPPTGIANGSTANKLKLYGDVNGDGNLVYVEYYCDNGDPGTAGSFNLYRNIMAFDTPAAAKPPLTNSMILLSNVHPNPVDAGGGVRPCFQYQTVPVTVAGTPYSLVLDVAVTLTVRTQSIDPITKQFQTETKALLNVSPRNVAFTWQFAGLAYTNRVQPTPPTVIALLP